MQSTKDTEDSTRNECSCCPTENSRQQIKLPIDPIQRKRQPCDPK